jgi:hypothetical protein
MKRNSTITTVAGSLNNINPQKYMSTRLQADTKSISNFDGVSSRGRDLSSTLRGDI